MICFCFTHPLRQYLQTGRWAGESECGEYSGPHSFQTINSDGILLKMTKNEQVMSETKRKNFTDDFKSKVVLEAIRGIKTVNETGREFVDAPGASWFMEE